MVVCPQWRCSAAVLLSMTCALMALLIVVSMRSGGIPEYPLIYERSVSTAQRMSSLYVQKLGERPLLVKGCTSLVLFGVSDVIAQAFSGNGFEFARVFRFAVWGMLVATPMMHIWYKYLQEMFVPKQWKEILAMAVVDQLCFTPVYTALYFWYDAVAKGNGLYQGTKRLRVQGRKVVLNTWCVWIPGNAFNFAFIPLDLRVLYVNCLAILWNIYFSLVTQRSVSTSDVTRQTETAVVPKTKATL